MKNINTYINEAKFDDEMLLESIINDDVQMTVLDVYEHMFDKMFEQYQIDEGFFSGLGKRLANLGKKVEEVGEKTDEKIEELSDDAKKAIENAKTKAGKVWDKIKDVYTNAVTAVDSAIKASDETISKLAEKFKVKKADLETLIANTCANAISSGKEIGEKMKEWTANAAKYPAQMAACATLISGAKIAIAAGYNSSMILDLLVAAGIK